MLTQNDVELSEEVSTYKTFDSMGIKLDLLKGVYKYGFEKPSVIQQKAIKLILDNRDVIAQAQSGTGKTAAFSIGALQNVNPELRKVQVLVISPTRELANQIHQVMSTLSDYLPIRCVAVCGGRNNIALMSRELSKGAHVIVGTPGRVLDLIRQGSLRLDALRAFILDEADEMLNRGLRTQLEEIYRLLPSGDEMRYPQSKRPQVAIVSATLSAENLELVQRFTVDPVCILVPRDELTVTGLRQFYVNAGEEKWKYEALCDLFASVCVAQTVVFVNTRRKVEWLSGLLRRDCFTVEAAHGDLEQTVRDGVMTRFRSGESRILVSSDIWARGIDVQNVGLVVNYDLPLSPSDYLHRIGRSGRFGRRGLAVSFVAGPEDRKQLNLIARHYDVPIEPAPARLDKMLTDIKVEQETDKLNSVVSTEPVKMAKKVKQKKKRTKRKRIGQ